MITHPRSGNVWQAVRENAPRQGHAVGDEKELEALFATDGLRDLLAKARRTPHRMEFGGASAEWLFAGRAESRKRSLRGND